MIATVTPLCSANVVDSHVHIHCALAGATILDENLPISIPTIRVTLPPLPAVTHTLLVPGPTVRVTEAPVIIPGSTTTKTVTIKPSQIPTSSASPRQNATEHVTITQSPHVRHHKEVVEHTKTNTIVHRVFVGTLVAICLLLLAILCAIGGYYFGYKDSDKAEKTFLRSLIERVRGERNT